MRKYHVRFLEGKAPAMGLTYSTPIRLIDFNNKSEVTLYKEIIKAVNGLIETKQASKGIHITSERRVLQRKMNLLWNLLISKVNLLYGLSDEDIREIEADELLNSDINED